MPSVTDHGISLSACPYETLKEKGKKKKEHLALEHHRESVISDRGDFWT